ncbi:MAG: hypothetical protein DUD39_04155 [Coriobacteriaceae bacterium]|nr:MAG: hypothetical protein DUD39_04155 [Coriobacteriaceae bacterium]
MSHPLSEVVVDAGTLVKIVVVTVVLTLVVIVVGGFVIGRLAARSIERDEQREKGKTDKNDGGRPSRP